MLFKEYIQNLTKIQTFQLYSLVVILILYPYFTLIDKNYEDENFQQNITKLKNNISKLNKKIETPNFIEVLKDFESEAKKYDSLNTINFKLNKKHITIYGNSKQKEFLKYLLFCENYSYTSHIYSLSYKPQIDSKDISFSFDIAFKEKYTKKISPKDLEIIHKKISLLDKNYKSLTLQGIIDKYAILNNQLLKEGDSFGEYIIEKINNNNIVLVKNKSKTTLYLTEQKND